MFYLTILKNIAASTRVAAATTIRGHDTDSNNINDDNKIKDHKTEPSLAKDRKSIGIT